MQYQLVQKEAISQANHPSILVGIAHGKVMHNPLPKKMAETLDAIVAQEAFRGELGESWILCPAPHQRLIFIECGGKHATLTASEYEQLIIKAAQVLQSVNSETLLCTLTGLPIQNHDQHWALKRWITLWEQLTTPQYSLKKKPAAQYKLRTLQLSTSHTECEKCSDWIKESVDIAAGINATRHLSDQPPNLCTPQAIADAAKKVAEEEKTLVFSYLDRAALKKEKMQGYIAVGAGSQHPEVLSILSYEGCTGVPVILIGKGMTFDSGGISLKPAQNMDAMKYDMCGAAAVLGIMKAVARLKLPIHLIGMMAGCENMPDGGSYRPGDIITMHSGIHVEVLNTDAEGRLVLADVLSYARRKYDPALMIDMATLTGACVVALGNHRSALFSTDSTLQTLMVEAGEAAGDWVWPMPLDDVYDHAIDSEVADINNCGGREGGAITAARFLHAFVGTTPWIHLDIAGTAYKGTKKQRATGRPVGAVVEFLRRWTTQD